MRTAIQREGSGRTGVSPRPRRAQEKRNATNEEAEPRQVKVDSILIFEVEHREGVPGNETNKELD